MAIGVTVSPHRWSHALHESDCKMVGSVRVTHRLDHLHRMTQTVQTDDESTS